MNKTIILVYVSKDMITPLSCYNFVNFLRNIFFFHVLIQIVTLSNYMLRYSCLFCSLHGLKYLFFETHYL